MEQFQNYVIEQSGDLSSEDEESSEEYYNNSFVPYTQQDELLKQNQASPLLQNKPQQLPQQQLVNQEQENVVLKEENTELKLAVEDLNKKMNFILEKMNSEDRKPKINSSELENNVHDLILFVLFGILVVMILDGFSKLVLKCANRN